MSVHKYCYLFLTNAIWVLWIKSMTMIIVCCCCYFVEFRRNTKFYRRRRHSSQNLYKYIMLNQIFHSDKYCAKTRFLNLWNENNVNFSVNEYTDYLANCTLSSPWQQQFWTYCQPVLVWALQYLGGIMCSDIPPFSHTPLLQKVML